ncbi:lamin tail domain containing 2, transcript variant X2 [Ictidomys tridecemlineatus]|nr:lamin tail domain containing 2, transcript variant X2 [Ictidomys tridecemlineatus]
MAPESGQQSEEKQEPRTPADGEPVSSDLGLPAGTPTDTVVRPCPQNTKTHSTRLAPEALDPRTLRLLWEQRELEIQALRWAIRNGPHARHCHILQEVSGLPSERSFHSPDKFLQEQVEKLTLELKAQKEQAQLEKEHLEEQLMQTVSMLQQLEAQLQAFQKSCLLQLACSSWVGRVLRSPTGSVEVVTAETLRDFSDFSENEAPTAGEGFRLEDMDWHSIALQYPNLFSDSSTKQKQPQQSPSLGKGGSDSSVEHLEKHPKNLEWSSLPCMATSSSGGAGSDSSSCQPVVPSRVQKASGYPPQTEDLASSEQIPTMAWSFGGDSEDLLKTHSQPPSKTPEDPCTAPGHRRVSHQLSPTGCCLKIVAVSPQEKFVRVLNESREETVDLDGFLLQQLERGFPVCLYRFPPGTLLAPQHHITVWGQGTSSTKKQPPLSLGQDAGLFHPSLGCLTLLLNPEGQVLSEHQTPHRVTSGSRIFTDNTDWSIDRFPLSKAPPGPDTSGPRSRPRPPGKSRVRETGARRRRPGMRDILPLLSTCRPFHLPEVPTRPEDSHSETLELLPPIIPGLPHQEGVQGPGECVPCCPWQTLVPTGMPAIPPHPHLHPQLSGPDAPQVCRKNVDRSCPMVTLSVQSTAESRYGFRFLSCPPITVDTCRRV